MAYEDPPPGVDEFDQEIECHEEENIEGYSIVHEEEGEGATQADSVTQTEACRGCKSHEKTIRHLKNQIIGLRTCLRNQRNLAWMHRKREYLSSVMPQAC